MKPRHKRLTLIVAGLAVLGVAAALVLSAFQQNLVFFYSPSQVANKEAPQGKAFRVGGLVEQGSLKRQSDGLTVTFNVTDTAKVIPVVYTGILPDLFKEGKGVVAQGKLATTACFARTKCWRSTTKTTRRLKPPMQSSRRKKRARRCSKDMSPDGALTTFAAPRGALAPGAARRC